MDAGYRGFYIPRPPKNSPGIMPYGNMAPPGVRPEYGMRPPNFPVYTRSAVYRDVHFADNPELQGNNFWVGPFDLRVTTRNAPPPVKMKKKKNKPPVPTEAPFVKKRKRSKKSKKAKKLKDAAENLQNQTDITLPQNSGVTGAAKNPQQPIPEVVSHPQNSGANAAKSLQQPMPQDVSQTVTSGAKNPQEPNPPGVSQPANVEAKEHTITQNGDIKKREAAGETRDTDVPTQPRKKMKTEEMKLPAQLPNIVIDYGWQEDTSAMFSCSLCQYQTLDEQEIQKHFYSSQHREILRHLYVFFPKDRVDFLHEYLLFKKKKMSLERKKNNLQPIKDSFKGIGPEHYLHRIQAAHCLACNVLIPDVPQLLTKHIRSDGHLQNQKATFKNIKSTSLAAAKQLLLDQGVLQMLKKYNTGQNPFKDIAVCSPQVSSTHEVLVAEEDDAITDAGDDDEEVSVNHNENTDSCNKVSLPDEPGTMEPDYKETSSVTVYTDEIVEDEETEEAEAAEAP